MRFTGFVPEKKWLLGLSYLYEYFGKIFNPQKGAFIAARVDL